MCEKLPIPFVLRVKGVNDVGADADKMEFIKFDFFVDSMNPASRHSKDFIILKLEDRRTEVTLG
jgi:hypothetical protein